jgi:heat shock protein HtpX
MNNLKTAVLLGLMGGLFVAVGYALGGSSGAIFALGFAVLFNFGVYFFSDKLALKAARARAVEEHEMPEVYAMVRSLAQRENMPMPSIYFIESMQPNAFATGRNPKHAAVAVTRGILDIMNQAELEGVLAHELAHVRNRDILIATIAATIGAALSFLARMYFWGGMGRRRDNNGASLLIGLAAMILAPIAAAVIQMGISRAREYQADRSGVESTGSPMALASALAKLEQGSRVPMNVDPAVSQLFIADPLKAFGNQRRRGGGNSFTKMFSTHPPIADRIDRLEKMQMGIR